MFLLSWSDPQYIYKTCIIWNIWWRKKNIKLKADKLKIAWAWHELISGSDYMKLIPLDPTRSAGNCQLLTNGDDPPSMHLENVMPHKTKTPETNIFSENGWLEYDRFLLVSTTIFRGRTVSFREGNLYINHEMLLSNRNLLLTQGLFSGEPC